MNKANDSHSVFVAFALGGQSLAELPQVIADFIDFDFRAALSRLGELVLRTCGV